MRKLSLPILIIGVAVLTLLVSCSSGSMGTEPGVTYIALEPEASPTETAVPPSTPFPTFTPPPTATIVLVNATEPSGNPTLVSVPTRTPPPTPPVHTATPTATRTPRPTLTPTSTPLPTSTPVSLPTLPPESEPRILWTDDCDPRVDEEFCRASSSLEILNDFYEVIDSLNGTLTYAIPHSVQDLAPYSVVIVDFCSDATNDDSIDAISQYIRSGGSAFIMGGNFCYPVGGLSTAWFATQLTQDFGVTFTEDDDFGGQWADFIEAHPVTASVENVFAFRHAYLNVNEPSQAVVNINGQPILAVYDDIGTFVALSDEGFHWGPALSWEAVSDSDNFVLWRNALSWLINQAQNKRQ